jgi:DNA-binding CsgD family transcriptional regulator
MNEITRPNAPYNQKIARIPEYSICGEFYLKKAKFFIILSKNDPKTSAKSDVNAYGATVGYFQAKGKYYLIVEAKEPPSDRKPDLAEILTPRELQIATLVALGCSNKEIANRLSISEWTISTHLRRIFIKLDVSSRAAMIYRCASLIHERLLENQNNATEEEGDFEI